MRYLTRIDDLYYAGDKSEVPADHVVKITWQVDGGPVREAELDLTGEHLARYGEPVEYLISVAQKNNTRPAASEPEGPVHRPDGTVDMKAARAYGAKLRAYADKHHMRARTGRDRPVYETPAGGSYMPHWLPASYEWWRKTGEVVIPESKSQERVMTRKAPPWDFGEPREE